MSWRQVSLVGILGAAFVGGGCAWGRFTDLKEDAPMVRLDPPDSHSGQFGLALAVAENGEQSELYVAGAPFDVGGLVYSLGRREKPQPNPTDESHCPSDEDCSAIERPVGVTVSGAGSVERELCFITGYGEISGQPGLWARCDDNGQIIYRVPSDVQAGLSADFDSDNPRALRLAANRHGDQVIVAGTPAQARAWYYEPLAGTPSEIETPDQAGDDFGAEVGVAQTDAGHLIAVGAPSNGEVWLYRVEGSALQRLGCLSGSDDFGRTIAGGDVDGDGDEDFVIADEDEVTVFSGSALSGLDRATRDGDCSEQSLSDDGELATLKCSTNDDAKGCSVSGFGDSLTVADVDGDGEGEIFVGAPNMAVRKEAKAGAVFGFDGTGERLSIQIVSNAEGGDQFGTSVTGIAQEGRDILAVGAAGSRHVYLLYCAAGTDGDGSARCQ